VPDANTLSRSALYGKRGRAFVSEICDRSLPLPKRSCPVSAQGLLKGSPHVCAPISLRSNMMKSLEGGPNRFKFSGVRVVL
jgi:hypothetical protein